MVQVDDIPLENVSAMIGDYDICVVKDFEMNSDVISRAKNMKLIMQFGVGLDGVDINAATKQGIKVAKIPSGETGNAASCAEMAIYLILALLRKQHQMEIAVKHKRLGEPIGDTLLGKIVSFAVVIMGFGNIGVHLAKRLCIGINGTNYNYDDLVDERGCHDDILKFASKADIVVCCLAMTTETVRLLIGIVNNDFISTMKKGALLINIGRGGVLDYEAVYNNLKLGHLGGLGIDVAWTEPFDPLNPILQLPNVIITPHVAGVTQSSFRYMAKVVGDVALQLHAGKMSYIGIEIVN
ncbi:hypothetical protein R3W88_017295 [Solanum pinnatisectum]|uniref:D-isomer specific 2-hydroxyacid dehydrogenase NAD-binding domain-containing protein n=1 Tax=Solanum pinnatisectum TaxID=50273 RepID=A0AAV9KZV2_9SOLN|nr:hypothetical protein R3W88_017295 [Solanum pinnatisectum]